MSVSRLFLHPALRSYREALFCGLGQRGFSFLFTMINPPGTHAGEDTHLALARFPFPYWQGREWKRAPVDNFSVDLMRALNYRTVCFSGLTSTPFLLLALPCRLLGRKIMMFEEVWRFPGDAQKIRPLAPLIRFLTRRCVNSFVVSGTKCAAMLRSEFGVADDRIFIAYNTTLDLAQQEPDVKRLAEIRARVSEFARGRKVFLYLGRLVKVKGADVAVRAFVRVKEDACLVIVGDGELRAECERLAQEAGIADRVAFFGECPPEEASCYYRVADAYVLCSRFMPGEMVNCETWGFAVNEAMSLEVPVVATTAVGATHDLILDGETGMLADSDAPTQLAEKMNFLLENDARRQKIGQQGREHLMRLCRIEQNLEAWDAALAHAEGGRS